VARTDHISVFVKLTSGYRLILRHVVIVVIVTEKARSLTYKEQSRMRRQYDSLHIRWTPRNLPNLLHSLKNHQDKHDSETCRVETIIQWVFKVVSCVFSSLGKIEGCLCSTEWSWDRPKSCPTRMMGNWESPATLEKGGSSTYPNL
jgi:hypothetical protein